MTTHGNDMARSIPRPVTSRYILYQSFRIRASQGNGNIRAASSTSPLTTYAYSERAEVIDIREAGANRTFPYQNIWTNNNTVDACLNQCAMFGYPAAGMEYSDECCGSFASVALIQCINTCSGQGAETFQTLNSIAQDSAMNLTVRCHVPVTQFTCAAGPIGCR